MMDENAILSRPESPQAIPKMSPEQITYRGQWKYTDNPGFILVGQSDGVLQFPLSYIQTSSPKYYTGICSLRLRNYKYQHRVVSNSNHLSFSLGC